MKLKISEENILRKGYKKGRLNNLNKKAQVESQFNWVFILIIGTLILALFAGLVLKMKSASEAKISGTITQQLNSIFTGVGMSPGTAQIISIPRTTIDFTCTDYYIGVASQRLGNDIIFAPSQISGVNIITWTLDLNIPFKVKNFLYVSGPFIRYVFYSPPSWAEKIIKDFPEMFTSEVVTDLSSLEDQNDDKIRVIFFEDPDSLGISTPSWFDTSDVSAVWINNTGPEKSVTFYSYDGIFKKMYSGEPTVAYYDNPINPTHAMMYGAMFTEDPEEYRCAISKAVVKADIVTDIYSKKYDLLESEFANTGCALFYSGAKQDLNAISESVKSEGFTGLSGSVRQLYERNLQVQLNSCPLLY